MPPRLCHMCLKIQAGKLISLLLYDGLKAQGFCKEVDSGNEYPTEYSIFLPM